MLKITANENDINDILQTFRLLLLSSSVHCKCTHEIKTHCDLNSW